MPEAGGITGPEITRVEKAVPAFLLFPVAPIPPAATRGRAGPAPHLGNTTEPTLLVEVWVSQPQSCKLGRAVPITHLSCTGVGGEEMPPLLITAYCLQQMLTLLFTSSSTHISRPCSLPRQHSRDGPMVGGGGDPALML